MADSILPLDLAGPGEWLKTSCINKVIVMANYYYWKTDTNHHVSLPHSKGSGQTIEFIFTFTYIKRTHYWRDNLFLYTTTIPLTAEILRRREYTTSTIVDMRFHTTTILHLLFLQLLLLRSFQVIDTLHSLGFLHMTNVSYLGPSEKDNIDIPFLR